MGVFIAMPLVMEALGGGAVTTAEFHRLIGTGSLDMVGYLLLGGVVVTISALCMLTSRFGVFRILNSKP
jgi:cell division transport system permease protein